MPTKREKGNAFQRWVKDWLEERGWLIRNFPMTSRMIKIKGKMIFVKQNNDVFGCDLIARKDRRCLWVQATLDSSVTKRQEEFERYLLKFDMLPGEDFLIWMKNEKGEINVKFVFMQANHTKGDHIGIMDIGKIIRRKFYCSEGVNYEF